MNRKLVGSMMDRIDWNSASITRSALRRCWKRGSACALLALLGFAGATASADDENWRTAPPVGIRQVPATESRSGLFAPILVPANDAIPLSPLPLSVLPPMRSESGHDAATDAVGPDLPAPTRIANGSTVRPEKPNQKAVPLVPPMRALSEPVPEDSADGFPSVSTESEHTAIAGPEAPAPAPVPTAATPPASATAAVVKYNAPSGVAEQQLDWGNAFAPAVQYNPCVPEEEESAFLHLTEGFLSALERPVEPMADVFARIICSEHDHPKTSLDGHPIGIQPIPPRPDLILQWNEEFLAPGFLEQGVCLPTGAVWRPSVWVFGTYRTGINYFDNGGSPSVVESANRLDLFSQLNLSGTERILLGLRPLDEQENGRREFTSYDFEQRDWRDGWNGDIQTLFFEGDFGEIFPGLDWFDTRALDYGFSIGRQPMLFQQGLLVNEDRIDALTITKNTLYGNGNLNMRATAVYAWHDINRDARRGPNILDRDGQMVGIFTESDLRESTVNADVGYVWSDDGTGDMIAFGISGIRRFHGAHNTYNSSAHVLASFPTNGETNLAGQGELLFSQFSWTPHHTEDLVYLNSFWAIDDFTSLSRGPLGGGALGQTGLLFSAAGLGRYGAPLNNKSSDVFGASLGYQMFFDHTHEQIVVEVGGRQDTDGMNNAAVGTAIRYQKALDQHWLLVVDGFVNKIQGEDVGQGARAELQMKF